MKSSTSTFGIGGITLCGAVLSYLRFSNGGEEVFGALVILLIWWSMIYVVLGFWIKRDEQSDKK